MSIWRRRPGDRGPDDRRSAARSRGRSTRPCGPRAATVRWSARSPRTWPTTSGGPAPGSSRRCSRRGRPPATGRWASAGSTALQPLIWHAAERPEAVEDVRAMRRRIIENVPPAERDREIKRGPGGLRDIEFAVQLLQLVHGRGDERSRSGSTLDALRALAGGGYVGRERRRGAAAQAYRFLRTVEHRLQLQRLRRTHTVPDGRPRRGGRPALAGRRRSASGADARRDAVEAFRADWVTHAQEVRRLHAKLLYRPLLEAVARVPAEALRLTPEAARQRLEVLGFADPAGALRHLEALTGGVSRVRRDPAHAAAGAAERVRRRARARPRAARLPAGLRHARHHPVVPAAAARRGPGGAAAGPAARPVPVRHRPARPRPGGAAAARRRRRAAPRYADVPCGRFTAAADRHGFIGSRGWRGGAGAAVRPSARCAGASCSGSPAPTCSATVARRPAVLARTSSRSGQALSDVTDATLGAALRAATSRAKARTDAVRDHRHGPAGRGGDELPLRRRRAVRLRAAARHGRRRGQRRRARSRRGAAPAARRARARPAAGRRRRPAPGGPAGSAGAQPRRVRAVLRATGRRSGRRRRCCGPGSSPATPSLGERFLALADRVRYPAGGLSREQVTEIRRIKARVDNERLPRGADPATHAKLGRGGLADVEWAVQLLQLRHGHEVAACGRPVRSTRWPPPATPAWCPTMDAVFLAGGWVMAARVRNALMLVRGRPRDQLPRQGVGARRGGAGARPAGVPSRASSSTSTCAPPAAPAPPPSACFCLPSGIRAADYAPWLESAASPLVPRPGDRQQTMRFPITRPARSANTLAPTSTRCAMLQASCEATSAALQRAQWSATIACCGLARCGRGR